MKKRLSKAIALMLMIVLTFPRADILAAKSGKTVTGTVVSSEETIDSQNDVASETALTAKLVRGTISVSDIDRYGNADISITCEDFFKAGYNYGDIVKVKINGKKYKLPFVSYYSDVDSGKPALIAMKDDTNIMLAINMGDFATTYGLASKEVAEDGSFEWKYADGSSDPIKVSVWMKKQGGYADEFAIRQLVWSNERSDYQGLSDEEFANFREVKTTGMGNGRLYRTSSPIDPTNQRNTYADNAIKNAGVSVIVNLTDEESDVEKYEGFSESYYSTVATKELAMDIDVSSEDFRNKLAEGLRFMAQNPGIYAIHCREGKDRAGLVTAILECLMGAAYEEVVADYMVSFYNYYGVTDEDPQYEVIVKGNLEKNLKNVFTFKKKDKKKDLSTRDLAACAAKYLKKIGLTKAEIKKLKKNLSKNVEYIEREVPLILENGETGSIKLRFYYGEPNIPYIGIKAYNEYMDVNPIKVKKNKSGNVVLTSQQGVKAIADPKAGTLTTDDWAHFHNQAAPYEGKDVAYRDTDSHMIRISEVIFEGESKPVTFDFGKYGLKMYTDNRDVYLSLSLVASLMNDISTNYIAWNGEKAYWRSFFNIESYDEGLLQDSTILSKSILEGIRPSDVAIETYNEMCFVLDYFYGYPGVAVLDSEMEEKGLNQALLDLGEEGVALIEGLKSTSMPEYFLASFKLLIRYLDDKGHTSTIDLLSVATPLIYSQIGQENMAELESMVWEHSSAPNAFRTEQIGAQRSEAWGDELYLEYGSTAVIRLGDFLMDQEGWEQYFAGAGDIPMDAIGITISGLRKAVKNPEIKNVLFDLSLNNGGCSDVLMYLMILLTGNNELYMYDRINDQKFTCIFEADTNLDGVIDEKDKEVKYDRFNYGVLTTKQAFSCGNLFPIRMHEEGAVLLGEPTGGGSCSIQFVSQPDGISFMMSSYQGCLLSADGSQSDIENGCKTDIPIAHKEKIAEKSFEYDYTSYFDLEMLDRMMNEWFSEKEEEKAA